MVQIQAVKRRGFLRQIAEAAKDGQIKLRDALLAAQKGHFVSTFSRGRLVVSQSGSGQSASFEIALPGKEWTQDNLFGLVEELIELAEAQDATLFPDDGTPEATDALFAQMIADGSMQGVRQAYGDFTALRFTSTR